MLTHNPDTVGAVGDGASGTGGWVADRVLHGELVTDWEPLGQLLRSASEGVRWLERAIEGPGPHHALGRYLADEERRTVGTRFDSYV